MRMRPGKLMDGPLGQRDLATVEYGAVRKGRPDNAQGYCARLRRRDVDFGFIRQARPSSGAQRLTAARLTYYRDLWHRPHPVVLEGVLSSALRPYRGDIRRSLALLNRVRASESAVEWLERTPYDRRLRDGFEIVCAVSDAGDAREMQKIYVNAVAGARITARDLFIKVNYLSLNPRDASLRLRFGFGEEQFRDWKAWACDQRRSAWSGRLAEAIFPESRLIAQNVRLQSALEKIIGRPVMFPERIIYSNAPNGGAYFHHDYVPTHVGVIFAQLHGLTGWLACSRRTLMEAIRHFLSAPEFRPSWPAAFLRRRDRACLEDLAADAPAMAEALEADDEGPLHVLINTHPAFIHYLIRLGALRVLRPGDVILLPAPTLESATWHSVFCLDDRPGLSLSFAMQPRK